jgi:DNA-binding IclR family transcriptional regulator
VSSRADVAACMVSREDGSFEPGRPWSFITHHAQVMLAVGENPERRVAEIAEAAGITRRSAYRILADLVDAGYVTRTRVGTHNRYQLAREMPLGDRTIEGQTVTDLLRLAAHRP